MISKWYRILLACDYKQQACAEACNKTLEYMDDGFDLCISKARKDGWLIDEASNIHVCPEHANKLFGRKDN